MAPAAKRARAPRRGRSSGNRRPHQTPAGAVQKAPEERDPLQALEDLHHEVERLAVLADLAAESMQDAPRPVGNEADRRRANRFYVLVSMLADAAEEARVYGAALLARSREERRRHIAGKTGASGDTKRARR